MFCLMLDNMLAGCLFAACEQRFKEAKKLNYNTKNKTSIVMENNQMEKSQSDIEFEAEMEALDRMFPDANFSICIGLCSLDDVISHDNVIAVRITHKCYCYMNNPRKDDLIYVYNESGNGITNKDVIDAMIEDGFDPDCGHVFYEGLRQVRAGVFVAHFGS